MVEQHNSRSLDHLVVNHGRTGDMPHTKQRRDSLNETSEKLRIKARRITTMDYVTEWNLLDDETDEHRS